MKDDLFTLHGDIERTHWWFVARRQILCALVRAIAPRGGTVVDVGCGTGANIAALSDAYRCIGVDASPAAIALASARYPTLDLRLATTPDETLRAVAEADVVMLCDVIEHIERDREFLASVIRSMRLGAQLLITVPADMSLWSSHDVVFGHFRRYDRQTLEGTWQGLDVTPRLVSYFNTRLFPVIRAIRAWRSRRPAAEGAEATDFRAHDPLSNAVLQRIFAGERHRLLAVLDGRGRSYARGASLCAVLERRDAVSAAPRQAS